jgi:excisionase family DNA binding protein
MLTGRLGPSVTKVHNRSVPEAPQAFGRRSASRPCYDDRPETLLLLFSVCSLQADKTPLNTFRQTADRTEPADDGSRSTYRSVAELAAEIGPSERSTRGALHQGEIPHIRIGRRFILPKAAIAEWLRSAGRPP